MREYNPVSSDEIFCELEEKLLGPDHEKENGDTPPKIESNDIAPSLINDEEVGLTVEKAVISS